MDKKGKEFIFPENVDQSYGVWKGYTIKQLSSILAAALVGIAIIALPPHNLIFMIIKIGLVLIILTAFAAILTIKPIPERPNITLIQYVKQCRKFDKRQKLFFRAPEKPAERQEFEINEEKDHWE